MYYFSCMRLPKTVCVAPLRSWHVDALGTALLKVCCFLWTCLQRGAVHKLGGPDVSQWRAVNKSLKVVLMPTCVCASRVSPDYP